MRASIGALAAAAMLLTAPAALAAPTCVDVRGDTIRCGSPGAMPVGWSPPTGRRAPRPPQPGPGELFAMALLVAAFFALIALMPEFDGWRPGDWDRQEGDEEEGG